MDKTNITIAIAVVALIVGLVGAFSGSTVVEKVIGASAGPDHTERQFFIAGSTDGSGCFSTSTTGTLTTGDLADNKCIRIAPAGAGQAVLSLTLPASSTMSEILPTKGSCASWFVDASEVAAATTTTFVAGSGHNVVGLDATGAGTGADVLDGAEYGKITSCRENDTDVVTFVEEYIAAD